MKFSGKRIIFLMSALVLFTAVLLSGCSPKINNVNALEESISEETTGESTENKPVETTGLPHEEESETISAPETEETQPETETTGVLEEQTEIPEATEEQTTAPLPATQAPVETPIQPTDTVTPTYIDGILVVNKTYPLPKSYAPGCDAEAYAQLMVMFGDAKAQGYTFWIASGYRSYDKQYSVYNNYVKKDGQAEADRYSARPGHSEHQSGLAFDLNYLTWAFGESAEGKWLAANCHKYGFIIRYPKDKEHITGYMYEPWHVRYLGVEKATSVYESGLCLEEYLGITSSYS